MNSLVSRYAVKQNKSIQKLLVHPLFEGMNKITKEQFEAYLLQKAVLSARFVQWYQAAYSRISSKNLREIIDKIIDEEEPRSGPAHYDLLLQDLDKIGIEKEKVRRTYPTDLTETSYGLLYGRVKEDKWEDTNIWIAAVLHTAGEVLVSPEYKAIVDQLEKRYSLRKEGSVFYYPHAIEDEKDTGAHSRAFLNFIESAITTDAQLAVALAGIDAATNARLLFFDQFSKDY